MNQQLVISKNIVDYFVGKIPTSRKNEALELIEYVEQNLFVSDKQTKHFNCILDQIEKLEASISKEEIKKILQYWFLEKKCFIDYEYDIVSESETDLTYNTLDKIYLQPLLSEKDIKKYNIKFNELEVHNSKTFINPAPLHKLKHLPSIISLQKDEPYDIIKIIDPFIRDSHKVRIEDPYLPNPKASGNVLKIIQNYPKINFDLVFLTRELFYDDKSEEWKVKKKLKQYDTFINNLLKLKNDGYSINHNNYFTIKKHRERYIFTEKFQIYIPGGFDFLNRDGYINSQGPDISDKKEIRIEKRKFSTEG